LDNFYTSPVAIQGSVGANSISVSNLTESTFYRAKVNSSSPSVCSNLVTSSVAISVSPNISGTLIAQNNQICEGGSVELSLYGNQGNIIKWQQSLDEINWVDILDTTNSYSEIIQDVGTYFYRVEIQNPICGSVFYTANKSITVISGVPPIGGVVSSASYCEGSNSGTLNLTGYSGSISKWQKSSDGGIVWTDILNTTSSNLYSAITATTYFRAVVSNGACGAVNSNHGSVVVSSNSLSGIASGNQVICGDQPISNISLSNYSGLIQWQMSDNNINYFDISGASNSELSQSYLSTNISGTSHFRAVVTSGICPGVISNTVVVAYMAPITYYQDIDGDGFGNYWSALSSCNLPNGYVINFNDCDDSNIMLMRA
jgi:hypothetical protein